MIVQEQTTNITTIFTNTFEDYDIRSFLINNEPYFVGKDIAVALGYANTRDAIKNYCKKSRRIDDILHELEASPSTTLQNPLAFNELRSLHPQTGIVPEGDVYRLVIGSKMPNAIRFQEWLFDEVLPSLRKQGYYQLANNINQTDIGEHLRYVIAEEYNILRTNLVNELKSEIAIISGDIRTDVNRLLQFGSLGDKRYSTKEVVDLLNTNYAPPGKTITKDALLTYMIGLGLILKNGSPMKYAERNKLLVSIQDPFDSSKSDLSFTKLGIEYIIETMIRRGFIRL